MKILLFFIFFPFIAFAYNKPIGLVTGPKTGTYINMGNDIAKVAAEVGIPILVKDSSGSVENIQRLNSAENAAIGIVQSDVLGFLSRTTSEESRTLASRLRMIMPLHREEIHILASKDIANLAGLSGKKLVVGEEGSGSWLTAANIFSLTKIAPAEVARLSPAEALVEVLAGRADAMIFVGGKPLRLFENLQKLRDNNIEGAENILDKVHFLAVDDERLAGEYASSTLSKDDYPMLITEDVKTIVVDALLVSFDFENIANEYGKDRCSAIMDIAAQIRNNLPKLVENGHAKWKEVRPDRDVISWKKSACVKVESITPDSGVSLEMELLRAIQKKD